MDEEKSRVAKLLKEKLDENYMIIWYCLNHRLKMAAHGASVEINEINIFNGKHICCLKSIS